jgi:hypothetical protein
MYYFVTVKKNYALFYHHQENDALFITIKQNGALFYHHQAE